MCSVCSSNVTKFLPWIWDLIVVLVMKIMPNWYQRFWTFVSYHSISSDTNQYCRLLVLKFRQLGSWPLNWVNLKRADLLWPRGSALHIPLCYRTATVLPVCLLSTVQSCSVPLYTVHNICQNKYVGLYREFQKNTLLIWGCFLCEKTNEKCLCKSESLDALFRAVSCKLAWLQLGGFFI